MCKIRAAIINKIVSEFSEGLLWEPYKWPTKYHGLQLGIEGQAKLGTLFQKAIIHEGIPIFPSESRESGGWINDCQYNCNLASSLRVRYPLPNQ